MSDNEPLFDEISKQAKGGRARARSLSGEDRRRIAQAGGRARAEAAASLPKVAYPGLLKLGDAHIPCAVLSDGRRVLTEHGIANAILGGRSGAAIRAKRAAQAGGAPLPVFVASDRLKPFIEKVLGGEPFSPIEYMEGRRTVIGYDPRLLRGICEIWLRAREAKALLKSQEDKAQKAEALMRALADVGIVALIDEVTGYQEVRARDELQKILAAYISPSLLPWSEKFPIDFFKEMFRVWDWPWPAYDSYRGPLGPRYAGKLIKQLILENLPAVVLDELEKRNPPNEKWQRKYRVSQFLTDNIGHPHVEKLVSNMTMLFRMSANRKEFWKNYSKAFNKPGPLFETLD